MSLLKMLMNTPKRNQKQKKIYFIITLLVISIFLSVAFLEYKGKLHLFQTKEKPIGVTGGADTKGMVNENTPSQADRNTASPEVATANPTDKQTSNSSTNLLEPWGTFANKYEVAINEQMGSTCNTTPGASCQISFTKDGNTVKLEVMTTDKGGATYWTWTPKQIGLTPGEWHITATATIDSQVKTKSNDPLTLKVSQ